MELKASIKCRKRHSDGHHKEESLYSQFLVELSASEFQAWELAEASSSYSFSGAESKMTESVEELARRLESMSSDLDVRKMTCQAMNQDLQKLVDTFEQLSMWKGDGKDI